MFSLTMPNEVRNWMNTEEGGCNTWPKLNSEAVTRAFIKSKEFKWVSPPPYQYEGGYWVIENGTQFTTTSLNTRSSYIEVTLPDKKKSYVLIDKLEWTDLCLVLNYFIAGCPENTVFPDNVDFCYFE